MKSIRRRMYLWLVPGFLVLWFCAGVTVFNMFRASEISRIDQQLSVAERSVRLMLVSETASRGPRRHRVRLPEFEDSASGYYYQIQNLDGSEVNKSTSLGERRLPIPDDEKGPSFKPYTVTLENGEVVRMLMLQTNEDSRSSPRRTRTTPSDQRAAVAVSLTQVNQSLSRLVTRMTIIAIAGTGFTALLIALALRDGLKPLLDLGRKMKTVNPNSIFTRFKTRRIPKEIEPVVKQVNSLLDRLEDGFHRERRFSADLAHELRTPIAETRSLIELGLYYPDELTKPQQQELLAANLRMEKMIESMLLLSKCEGVTSDLADESINLHLLVNECWQSYADDAEKRGIQLVINVPEDQSMMGNPDLWHHLVRNLLSNSVDHSPQGSTVRITSSSDFLFEITNPAPNLDRDGLGRMFDRLWRADRARSGDKHCGLGLSIASACAEALGVKLDATLDQSSSLSLRIR